jgi:DNA-binding MarR family transcriptional regulator
VAPVKTTLQAELRQNKPFGTDYQEAYLSIVRTASALTDGMEEALKPYGLSATQYNVLRILRGSEPGGLCRNDLRSRLLTRMPDVTRLLDRMEEAGLVARTRDSADRRMVLTRITPRGSKLLAKLDDVIPAQEKRALGHMNKEQLRTLIELLRLARERA